MAFSAKRAKALKEGRVRYNIYDSEGMIYSAKTLLEAIQMADRLQKSNPGEVYTMKLEEVQNA